MIDFNSDSKPEDYQFYMRGELKADEEIKLISLRDELSYDSDPEPNSGAVKLLADCFQAANLKVMFLWASDNTGKSSALRLKKFSIESRKLFSAYKRTEHEVFVDDSNSRLVSKIELDDFNETKLPHEILYSATGLFIVSPANNPVNLNEPIVSREYSSNAFDVRGLLHKVRSNNEFCILRYFPADNGRSEAIALIGKRDSLLMRRIANCITRRANTKD